MTRDGNGFKASLNNTVAAFGTDSRFGVVKDDLIEMPVAPVTIDNRPFVPWQFFQGFLIRASGLDATWDRGRTNPADSSGADHRRRRHGLRRQRAGDFESRPHAHRARRLHIVKEPGAYTVRFKTAIRAPYVEQAHDDPYVAEDVVHRQRPAHPAHRAGRRRRRLPSRESVPRRPRSAQRRGRRAGNAAAAELDAAGRGAGHPHDRHRSRPRRKRSRRDRSRRIDGEGRHARALPAARRRARSEAEDARRPHAQRRHGRPARSAHRHRQPVPRRSLSLRAHERRHRQRRARRRDLLPLARRLGQTGREGRGARERVEEHRGSGRRRAI